LHPWGIIIDGVLTTQRLGFRRRRLRRANRGHPSDLWQKLTAQVERPSIQAPITAGLQERRTHPHTSCPRRNIPAPPPPLSPGRYKPPTPTIDATFAQLAWFREFSESPFPRNWVCFFESRKRPFPTPAVCRTGPVVSHLV
jgi:hypothetical protein